MRLHIESVDVRNLSEASDALAGLARDWGTQVTVSTPGDVASGDNKTADPIAVAAVVMSIPSAVWAVTDLVDRVIKRRRANDLVERTRALSGDGVTVLLTYKGRLIDVSTLTGDELLELAQPDKAPDAPASSDSEVSDPM